MDRKPAHSYLLDPLRFMEKKGGRAAAAANLTGMSLTHSDKQTQTNTAKKNTRYVHVDETVWMYLIAWK
jgi:hypothetical protein